MEAVNPSRLWRGLSRAACAGAIAVLAIGAVLLGCAKAPRAVAAEQQPAASSKSVALYALSKGKGVPEPTREALRSARDLLQGLQREDKVSRFEETRIGLEGETRLCVELKDARTAQQVIERLRALAGEVELMNVKEEPCVKH